MKKDEILKKARAEQYDEMELAVRDRAAVWMAIAMTIAAVFLFVCAVKMSRSRIWEPWSASQMPCV